MLAEAVEDGVKSPPQARRAAAPRRGLVERVRAWLAFTALDGRSAPRAAANAPFEPRGMQGFVLLALVPGLLLLLAVGTIFWRPLTAEPDSLSTIPVDVPAQTDVERSLVHNIAVLREGLWEARLPPWSDLPSKGLGRISNPQMHAELASLIGEIAALGASIANRAPPGVHRDRVIVGQIVDLQNRLRAMDSRLGGTRSVIAYHLGLLALWAGDAGDAEPQFASALAIVHNTQPLDDVGRHRLDGIEASSSYGLGLAEAGRGLWARAIADFDVALAAACRAASEGGSNAGFGFVLGRPELVALDTRSIRNDRLIALLRARNLGDEAGRAAVTSPSCAQLQNPSRSAPSGDADAEARALFTALPAGGDTTLAANLQMRAALMGERDVVQRLSFEGADAESMQAQALAHAIAGFEATDNAVDKSALADLQKLSVLRSKLAAQIANGTLSEPENDPAWVWSDPGLFVAWKTAVGAGVADELLAKADNVRDANPGLASALYGVVLDNRAWLSSTSVFDAWWRLNTGTSLDFVLTMLALAAGLSAALLLLLHRWRATYRTTFESYHHEDRLRAPEG